MARSAGVEVDVEGRTIVISSPTKSYFDALGLSKLDVVGYYRAVGPGILAALRDRPTTLERWPQGVVDPPAAAADVSSRPESFFQKRAPANLPDWVQTATVRFPSGRTAVEVAPDSLAAIIWLVNLGTLRFHPWPVRAFEPDKVDQLRIDLDPQPGVSFEHVVAVALELRSLLAELDLIGFCKTSGGRGLHVYAAVEPIDFVDARHAVIAIGRELARRMPQQVTVNWWKEERGRRVFVDYNQMARDRLMTSAYSIRPTPLAQVSAPLFWDEVGRISPGDFTVATMPARWAEVGDPWAGMEQEKPGSVAAALDWYRRDDAAGEGELPYPPEYPKMPGEPPRVQPSRAKQDQ